MCPFSCSSYYVTDLPAWLKSACGDETWWAQLKLLLQNERSRQKYDGNANRYLRIETIEDYTDDAGATLSLATGALTAAGSFTVFDASTRWTGTAATQSNSAKTSIDHTVATKSAPAATADGSTEVPSSLTSTEGPAPTSLVSASQESQTPSNQRKSTGLAWATLIMRDALQR